MTDPGELVSGLFALVVAGFITIVLLIVFSGGEITGLVNAFAEFMPGFVVFLILLFFLATIAQQF